MSTTEPSRPRSQIEQVLSLRRLGDKFGSEDVFVNKAALECPPWARGVYGGQIIAQSLLAAYETVPANFAVHSIHCHFLTAAAVDQPIAYHVDRVREGKSFNTRAISARQHQKVIFSATASFSRDGRERAQLQHAVPMPRGEFPPGDDPASSTQSAAGQAGERRPCDCIRSPLKNQGLPSDRRLRQWIRARGQIGRTPLDAYDDLDESTLTGRRNSPTRRDNHHAHVAALAYMTDNYFIGTAFRVHNATRFSNRRSPYPMLSKDQSDAADEESSQRYLALLAEEEIRDNRDMPKSDMQVEMMVTMDHTIFFHEPRHFRADEWLLAEMESPWAGDERGLVIGRIWSKGGTLIATCIQEGLVRVAQDRSASRL
jgi:acyl-coenzyme A thioesterase 1/2/4